MQSIIISETKNERIMKDGEVLPYWENDIAVLSPSVHNQIRKRSIQFQKITRNKENNPN